MSGSVWFYWREYYIINRSTWPDMGRVRGSVGRLQAGSSGHGALTMAKKLTERVGPVPNVFTEADQRTIAAFLGVAPKVVQAVGYMAWIKARRP